MNNYMGRVEKRTPPSNVVFGEQVAFIPAIPGKIGVALWKHTMSSIHFSDLYEAARFGSWINRGDKITGFGIFKHKPKCNWCSVIGIFGHGRVVTAIYSPLSGLVIGTADNAFGSDYRKKLPADLEVGKAMLAVLLPNNVAAPVTADKAFEQFCDICSQYREVIFFNEELQETEYKDGKFYKKDTWSHDEIDQAFYNLRKCKIVVRPLSDLSYKEEIDELKRKYPANFR